MSMSGSSIGANGLAREEYMQLKSFGALQISVTPRDGTSVMSVDIGAENRMEAVNMATQKDETVDQFCLRIKSMLRSLWNTQPREPLSKSVAAAAGVGVSAGASTGAVKKEQSWDEQKKELEIKSGKAAAPGVIAK